MTMAKEVPATEHYISLYDSANGQSLSTLKAVDVTDECPGNDGKKVVLLYTKAQRGRIAQIRYGAMIHFFVDELDNEMHRAPRDDTFGSTAERLGLDKLRLRSLIEQHAPTA
jgi:hypothetical protein